MCLLYISSAGRYMDEYSRALHCICESPILHMLFGQCLQFPALEPALGLEAFESVPGALLDTAVRDAQGGNAFAVVVLEGVLCL